MTEKKATVKVSATVTEAPDSTPCETTESKVPFLSHVKKGAADLMVQHLHGVAMSLTTFLNERERAIAENRHEKHQTLKHLTKAHKQYRAHTHDAPHEFIEHVLAYDKTK